MKDKAQPVAGHDAHQAGRVNDARHGAPEPGLADLADVRVHWAVVESQAQAHGQGGRVQPRHRVGIPQHHPADHARSARHEHARFLAVPFLHVPGRNAADRLAQVQYASCVIVSHHFAFSVLRHWG